MDKKKIISIILAFALAMTFTACGETKKELTKYSKVFCGAFDTEITLLAYCENEESFDKLFDIALKEFVNYHKLFDIYNSYDGMINLKVVNDMAGQGPVKVDTAIIELLEYSKELYKTTGGKMNIAMGAVLRHWHDAREIAKCDVVRNILPDINLLQEDSKHCSIDDIVIDRTNGTVELQDAGMSLDVGAVAKGFATEKVIDMIAQTGAKHVLINAGGNVRALGLKPDGAKWKVGIQNPQTRGGDAYAETVDVENKSVVTSGVYERFFEFEGRRYHHIIDPDTLFPELRYQSVTIMTEDSALADALSTAVFNMELEEGQSFIKSMDGVEAMWILNDGSLVFSENFKNKQ